MKKDESMSTNRRGFFKVAGAAGVIAGSLSGSQEAAAGSLPSPKADPKKFIGGKFPKGPVMAKGRVLGANDRVNVGHIGLGFPPGGAGMGAAHVTSFKKLAKERNTQSIGLCDVYSVRVEKAKAKLLEGDPEGVTIQTEKDYRKLLENKDIDAVIIATPEHWHCEIAVHAMDAGKHVYIQKPMARYLDEAFQVWDAQKRTGRIAQVGSQGTSDPRYHAAREAIASGKLGPLVSAQSSYTRNSKDGEWNYAIDEGCGPDNLDWGMWLGSATKRPWNDDAKARFFRYRKYRDYSAGILGDLMPHRIHPLLLAAGGNDWPLKVTCVGTRQVSTDREVSDTVHVVAEMERGWTFMFVGSTVNEQGLTELVRGHKATMYLAGKEPEIKPERPFAEEIEGGMVPVTDSGESHAKHESNFLDAIRGIKPPNCPVELAVRAQVLISLAEISEVSKRSVVFDPAKRSWKFA
jgi:predicted dehydrogenase